MWEAVKRNARRAFRKLTVGFCLIVLFILDDALVEDIERAGECVVELERVGSGQARLAGLVSAKALPLKGARCGRAGYRRSRWR